MLPSRASLAGRHDGRERWSYFVTSPEIPFGGRVTPAMRHSISLGFWQKLSLIINDWRARRTVRTQTKTTQLEREDDEDRVLIKGFGGLSL